MTTKVKEPGIDLLQHGQHVSKNLGIRFPKILRKSHSILSMSTLLVYKLNVREFEIVLQESCTGFLQSATAAAALHKLTQLQVCKKMAIKKRSLNCMKSTLQVHVTNKSSLWAVVNSSFIRVDIFKIKQKLHTSLRTRVLTCSQ